VRGVIDERALLGHHRLRIEMLRTRARNNVELTQHYLAQMDGEVGYLQRLVDNLLDLATVENSEPVIPKAPLDLASILYDVSDEMSVVAQQAGLEFQTDIPEHLPTISANADQMKILIRNLIDNAIKYTHRGGKISLTANSPRGEIEIQVTDTGIGIPAEALPHIFERFYRVDTARSRDTSRAMSSTGLGLALVQRIAQSHGGRAEVASWIGKGSTFTVQLPIRSDN
jgi:two-component system, OmpR family, phosphate regulon sensor histidine kinase PhoR